MPPWFQDETFIVLNNWFYASQALLSFSHVSTSKAPSSKLDLHLKSLKYFQKDSNGDRAIWACSSICSYPWSLALQRPKELTRYYGGACHQCLWCNLLSSQFSGDHYWLFSRCLIISVSWVGICHQIWIYPSQRCRASARVPLLPFLITKLCVFSILNY